MGREVEGLDMPKSLNSSTSFVMSKKENYHHKKRIFISHSGMKNVLKLLLLLCSACSYTPNFFVYYEYCLVKFIHLFLCFRAKTQHFMLFVLGISSRVLMVLLLLVYLHYTLILLFYFIISIHFILNKFVVTENWLHSLKWHKIEKEFWLFWMK